VDFHPAGIERSKDTKARRAGLASAAVCLAVLLAGCDFSFPGQPNPKNRPVPENEIADFAQLFGTHCAGCHGADGQLGPAPPLNDAMFLAIVTDDELLHLVDRGRAGTPMPGFSRRNGGPLTDKQVQILARGIKPRWNKTKDQAASPQLAGSLPPYALTPPEGKTEADEAAARGRQRFAQACGDCHGANGEGDSAGRLNDPDFLALASDQMLRRIIITGRPDLGMPDFAGNDGRADNFQPLSSDEIDDLVALLAQWRVATADPSQPQAKRGEGISTNLEPLDRMTRKQDR
jgi:mono/diheme cytochrome c family protein